MRWPFRKRKWNVVVWSLDGKSSVKLSSRSSVVEARSAKQVMKAARAVVDAAYPRGSEHHIDVWEAKS